MPKASSVQSVLDAKKRLQVLLKKLDTVPREELERSAQIIKENAIAQTPYKSGNLERSVYARVTGPKNRPQISVGANAFSQGYNYAGIQHESESFQHPIKGKAHYISDPFNEEVDRLKKRLREELKP